MPKPLVISCRKRNYLVPLEEIVGNKAKDRTSKRVFQENKARQIFRKNKHILPPVTQRYVCVSGDKKCLLFRRICRALFSWNARFEVLPFALLPTNFQRGSIKESKCLKTNTENCIWTDLPSVFLSNKTQINWFAV